jgi:hypothetical protein
MSLEQSRSRVTASVWQSIAQSGVDLTPVPQDQQQKLVAAITDNVLVTMDALLDEIPKPQAEPEEDELGEKILWQGRPFLSLVETYTLTSERIKIVRGLVSRDVENFELIRVQDIDLKQNVGERMLGIGDIAIRGQDASRPVITLRNVAKPEEVYEALRRAWLESRKRHGLQFREYM